MTQTALAQESCKLPSLHITHIMHNWKSHEQRIGCYPQEHRTVFLFHLPSNQKLLQMQEYTHVLMHSVPDPLHMFLTMPQCHMRANKCSMRAL